MNGKKTKLVPISLPKAARSLFDVKKMKEKKYANLDFSDNPIHPISIQMDRSKR